MSCVPFVIRSGRSICGTSGERSICSIARQAWRTVYGSLTPITERTVCEGVLALLALEEGGADRLRRDVVGEVVPRHRLGHPPPDAEQGRAGRRRASRTRRRRRSRSRARRGAPRTRSRSSRPSRCRGRARARARARRAASRRRRPSPRSCTTRAGSSRLRSRGRRRRAAGSRLAEAVVDEAEVVPAEEAAAELDHDRPVLGPGQLVVELDSLVDLRVRHASASSSGRVPKSDVPAPGRAQSQVRPTRSHATSLGSHSVLIREMSRSTFSAAALRARRRGLRRRSTGTPRTAPRTPRSGTRRSAWQRF